MKNILLTLTYDGTKFHGYQVQPGLRTVEGTLSKALESVFLEPVEITSAGRTDAGVHAFGQRANIKVNSKIDIGNLPRVLNQHLPVDVTVIDAEIVDDHLHARFSAKQKHYRYIIYNGRYEHALYYSRTCQVLQPLDEERMLRGLEKILGTHDFYAFVGRHGQKEQTIRTIDRIELKREGELIFVDFYAMSFLKNMIRIIMGTAIQIGRGRMAEDALYRATLTRNRKDLGPTAPPEGLYLMDIDY